MVHVADDAGDHQHEDHIVHALPHVDEALHEDQDEESDVHSNEELLAMSCLFSGGDDRLQLLSEVETHLINYN